MEKINLFNGDNLEVLKTFEPNSIDSIVTDPPYGLSFMNKKWDYDVPSVEFWKEVYRVLKPGGHILSFGGTRTYHRMVVNIEDAGFEIRDQIMWIYGSGFPKSLNIGKAIDKRGGESIGWFGQWLKKWREENEIPQSQIAELFPSKSGGLTGCVSNWELGNNLPTNEQFNKICKTYNLPFKSLEEAEREFIGTKTSGIGKAFTKDGWGSGNDEVEITKGSSEYEGWGTGLKPANEPICVARKPLSEKSVAENVLKWGTAGINIDGCRIETSDNLNSGEELLGRFPTNIIFDEESANILEEQNGGASRFFYVAKTSKKERNLGLEKNNHPTVKPIKLMSYLCKLITPPNGIILDPYMGSGSTGIGSLINDFNFIGIEMEPDYFKIAEGRINNFEEYKNL